jgi:predicted amidophosphoribosyltransferase
MEWTPAPPGIDWVVALGEYRGELRAAVLQLKGAGRAHLLPELADRLAFAVDAFRPDVVTWVPTTPERRRGRGFDQSRLLARAVGRRLRAPSRALLVRRTGAQHGLDGAARRSGLAFEAHRGCPLRVLLVDDVMTTGASLSAAAGALRAAGAMQVVAAVVCVAAPPSAARA